MKQLGGNNPTWRRTRSCCYFLIYYYISRSRSACRTSLARDFFLAATKPFANMIRIGRMGGRETLSARLSYVTYCPFLGLCAGNSHSTRLTIQPGLFETHTQYHTGHRKQTIGQSICRAGQAKHNRGFTEYGVLFLWGRCVSV
jgi:hypothetical protein